MSSLDVFVPGIPVQQGSKRHVGGGRMVEDAKGLPAWRDSVIWAVRDEMGRNGIKRIDGPASVDLVFQFVRPRSVSEKRRPHHTVSPDLDKLVRAVFDALTQAGAWRDDAQAISVTASKNYAEAPGAFIYLQERP